MDTRLTRRQAGLRSAAVAALCGLALLQAIELPYNLAQARQVAALSGLALVACAVLAVALTVARAGAAAPAWGAVAAIGAVALGGWALTRAIALPGLAGGVGRWAELPGLATAGLGLACLGLAAAGSGVRPSRAAAAALAKACALAAALMPAAGATLVALGPGPGAGEGTFAGGAEAHVHLHGGAGAAGFRPGFGGHAGNYIYPNAIPPQLPPWALALVVGAAVLFVYLAAGALRRRCAPAPVAAAVPRAASAPAALVALAAATAIALGALGAAAPSASAHATLLSSDPAAAAHAAAAPAEVRLTFSEPVQIVRQADVSIVDGRGRPVAGGEPRTDPRDPRRVTIALRRGLAPDSYTVRYRVIAADAHAVDDALVFALGNGRLRPPVLRGAGGLSETGPWAVAARFAELTALGLLLGLLVFRALVWGPALGAATRLSPQERASALAGGSRLYWRAFWGVAGMAGLAEAGVLAAKSAIVFHTSLAAALADPQSAYRLVAASRFGDLLGWRSGLLVAIVAVASWEWASESQRPARPAGRPLAAAAIGALSVGTLGLLSAQGHASQAPLAPLSVLADALHLSAAGVWIGGLACLVAVLLRAPRALVAPVLARFSRIALAAVGVIVATGLLRLAGELSGPADLWRTAYGTSVAFKALLLCPVALLALRSRRALRTLPATGAAALRGLRRDVRVELAVGLNIVVIAALLVAQVPGRDAPRTHAPPARSVPTQSLESPLVTGVAPAR
jgi:copper transport protein